MEPELACKLGLQPGDPGADVVGLIVDAVAEAGQHLLAHRLRFFDGLGLGRPEQHVGLRGNGGTGEGNAGHGAGQFGK